MCINTSCKWGYNHTFLADSLYKYEKKLSYQLHCTHFKESFIMPDLQVEFGYFVQDNSFLKEGLKNIFNLILI